MAPLVRSHRLYTHQIQFLTSGLFHLCYTFLLFFLFLSFFLDYWTISTWTYCINWWPKTLGTSISDLIEPPQDTDSAAHRGDLFHPLLQWYRSLLVLLYIAHLNQIYGTRPRFFAFFPPSTPPACERFNIHLGHRSVIYDCIDQIVRRLNTKQTLSEKSSGRLARIIRKTVRSRQDSKLYRATYQKRIESRNQWLST